ncbi:MAG: hypothetical protein AAF667_09450 [Pseudomonadota bacterium]
MDAKTGGDLPGEVMLRAMERIFESAVEDIEVLVSELRDIALEGELSSMTEAHATIRKLDQAAMLLTKERQKVEERLRNDRGAEERFALDLAAARTAIADRLAALARAGDTEGVSGQPG